MFKTGFVKQALAPKTVERATKKLMRESGFSKDVAGNRAHLLQTQYGSPYPSTRNAAINHYKVLGDIRREVKKRQ